MNKPQQQADNQLRKTTSVVIFILSVLLNLLAAALFGGHNILTLVAVLIAVLLNTLFIAALLKLFRLIDFDAGNTALVEQRCVLLAVMLAVLSTPLALLAAWFKADILCAPVVQLAVLVLAYVLIAKAAKQR